MMVILWFIAYVTEFPFADKISKLPVKNDYQPQTEKYVGEEDVHTSAWDLKRQFKSL